MSGRKKKLLLGRSLVVGVGDSILLCSTGVILLASSICGATLLLVETRLVADMIPEAAERPRAVEVSYSLFR